MSIEEIARETGMTTREVQIILAVALRKLRRHCKRFKIDKADFI